jgi:hypothetical protein
LREKGKIEMNFIEKIISIKLQEKEPTLNLQEYDHKVLQVACQDFINYAKYTLHFNAEQTSNFEIAHSIEHFYKQDPSEADAFITVWTGLWLKKWKARVKLLIGNQTPKNQGNPQSGLDQLERLDCKQEMIETVVSVLLKNGEICGAEVLASGLLRNELSKKADLDVNNKKQLLVILSDTLRKAHDMVQTVGPLVFVKVGKEYYEDVKSSV